MKKQRIKNRVYLSILAAILIQCIVFGVILLSTGVYSSIVNEPYRILRSQMEEKNKLVSGNMNIVLLEGEQLYRQIKQMDSEAQIQERIVESLSRQNSVSGVLWVNVSNGGGFYFLDSEPAEQAAEYGDISCRIGRVMTDYRIALDTRWRSHLSEEDWRRVANYLEHAKGENRWCYYNGALYYVMAQEYQGITRVMALELKRDIMETMMKLNQTAYDGMQAVIMENDQVLYGAGSQAEYRVLAQEDGIFAVDVEGESYVGIRGPLQNYGRTEQDKILSIGLMCKEEALTRLGRDVAGRTVLAYAISILTAGIVAYLALRQVMKPWDRLHDEIKRQNISRIHFDKTGVPEVDTIYESLNSMITQLERSYARYSFAMEAAGEHLGSFEYQYGRDEVIVSPSVRHILQIPEEMYREENKIGIEDWTVVNTRLHPAEGLDGYLIAQEGQPERYVTIQTKEESGGIFGVIIDKTGEYRKISSLQYLSEHDNLTGLYNGAYFKEAGQKVLHTTGWKRSRQTIQAVVFCDLDNLKTVNDSCGHKGGDAYLCGMAKWMKEITEKEDAIVARMSGDEFAILFYGYNNRAEILEHMEKAYADRPSIELPGNHSVRLSASVGIAFHSGKGGILEQLLKEADEAMYRQKRGSKNGICVYG